MTYPRSSCLLGYPDSNQERQDQNLQCYHYTIAQSYLECYFLIAIAKVSTFAELTKLLTHFLFFNFQLLIYLSIFAPLIDTYMEKENTGLLIEKIVKGMMEKKARDIVVADLTYIEDTICKAFVICTAGSPAQVAAIADSVGETARKEAGSKPTAVSGLRNSVWVAMDYSDVMVHIFLPDERDFYDLEHLWADARLIAFENQD